MFMEVVCLFLGPMLASWPCFLGFDVPTFFLISGENVFFYCASYIREYGSTLYVWMAWKKGRPYISIASDDLKSPPKIIDKS